MKRQDAMKVNPGEDASEVGFQSCPGKEAKGDCETEVQLPSMGWMQVSSHVS